MSESDLRVEITVGASIDQTFAAFTQRADEWWPRVYRLGPAERTGLQIDSHEGGRWYEIGADGTTSDWGGVLAWAEPTHVALGWQITPAFARERDPERASRVDVSFVADRVDRTRVTLLHSGFERHGDGWESMRQGVDGEGG